MTLPMPSERLRGLDALVAADAGTSKVPIRIAITLRPDTDPETARDQLAVAEGITTEAPAGYPAPLAALLRTWAGQHHDEDIAASLTKLQEAIRRDQQRDRRDN
jgi:hypothetical protein